MKGCDQRTFTHSYEISTNQALVHCWYQLPYKEVVSNGSPFLSLLYMVYLTHHNYLIGEVVYYILDMNNYWTITHAKQNMFYSTEIRVDNMIDCFPCVSDSFWSCSAAFLRSGFFIVRIILDMQPGEHCEYVRLCVYCPEILLLWSVSSLMLEPGAHPYRVESVCTHSTLYGTETYFEVCFFCVYNIMLYYWYVNIKFPEVCVRHRL